MKYIPNADIFSLDAECIVNPVNCQAHKLQNGRQMGLAGAFEKKFPSIQPPFKRACQEGALKPGRVQLIRVDSKTGERSRDGDKIIANVATKDHWRDPSKIEWVDEGLRKLAGAIEERGIKSVAIPKLGAGFGKLPWSDVRKSIDKHFGPLADKGLSVMVVGEAPEIEGIAPKPASLRTPDILESPDKKYVAGIGARNTSPAMLQKLKDVSKILAERGHVLRSGGAEGPDSACEDGWDEAGGEKQIFLSWKGMNNRQPDGRQVFAFNYSDDCAERRVAMSYYRRTPSNPDGDRAAWDRLGRGGKSHMTRNTNQVLGPNPGVSPQTDVILCATKNGEVVGGTGQALRIADDKGIPVVNLGDPKLKGLSAVDLAHLTEERISGISQDKALENVWSKKSAKRTAMER